MAITLLSSPETYSSLSDDVYFVVSSDNAGNLNFKFIFDIYINSTLVARLKNYPDPNSKGIVNVSNVIRNYWATYFKPNSNAALPYSGLDNYVEYTIQFGEEYGGVVYSNLTSTSAKTYNYYQPIFRNYSASYYSTYGWLTNRSRNYINCLSSGSFFSTYKLNSAGTISLTVKKYSQDNTLLATQTGATSSSGTIHLINISPTAINTYLGGSFINDDTFKYGVSVNNADEIYIYPVCNYKYNPETITFLNQLGGYESYIFRNANRLNTTNQKKSFESMAWKLNASNQMIKYDTYNKYNPGLNTYFNNAEYKYKFISDLLDATDYTWINEMINSTECYLHKNGYYYPINITTTNWEQKYKTDRNNTFITIDAEIGNINSQFR